MTAEHAGQRPKVGLVGCVKSKRPMPASAADLYTSALFRGRRRWVETTCSRSFILSAKHGLLDPTSIVAPYNETLNDKSLGARRAWAQSVLRQLHDALADVSAHDFEVHAGASYINYGLKSGLIAAGCEVLLPAEGLRQGEQLALYRDGPTGR